MSIPFFRQGTFAADLKTGEAHGNSIDGRIWFADSQKRFILANQAGLREVRPGARDGLRGSASR